MTRLCNIAHRGASGNFPENTRLAFEKALETGADMIEIDCQLSRDGHVIVFHDERLDRTAGVGGRVHDRTLAELKTLDIGSWRKRAFSGQRILTLEEALSIICGRADLCVEIKAYAGAPRGIEIKLLFILSHYDYLHRTIIASFDIGSLARVRELAPEARLGVIAGSAGLENPFERARQIGAASLHIETRLVTRELIDRARLQGLHTFAWTVNDAKEMARFAALGVNGLITDFPERLAALEAHRA
ncbi:MAG TPA: glycerophosphodiester phosphodiesterase family protein [Candidatus Eisenbacteria bacterium]|nr:glycerophosphodiester phosphodiesterase family protein [Candidatus Eisenbacteria bacterium]